MIISCLLNPKSSGAFLKVNFFALQDGMMTWLVELYPYSLCQYFNNSDETEIL